MPQISTSWDPFSHHTWGQPKQLPLMETTEDLLALSVTWHRIRNNPRITSPDIASLSDQALLGCVKAEDRARAEVIRDYYSKKIMLWALHEVKLSKFRTDLSTFIASTDKTYTEDILPLVFRLPEFYEYDQEFATLKREFNCDQVKWRGGSRQVQLYPVKNTNRKLRSGYKHEYWLKDDHGQAYLILIDHLNCCKSMWDREFKTESITIDGAFFPLTQDGLPYLKVLKWSV